MNAELIDQNGNVVPDADVPGIVAAFGRAAALAQKCGFDFVDVKCAHGYLGHEFLAARTRPGPYGGTFENRTRFFRECIAAVRAAAPGNPLLKLHPYRAFKLCEGAARLSEPG